MNTSNKYLKEINYRPAKCCGTCTHFVDVQGQNILYCRRHDNPVSRTSVCKLWQRPTPRAVDGGESAPLQAESTPEEFFASQALPKPTRLR